jgi:tRNA threonylcarbamoyladenosine biosynthesis protein TsaE
MTHLAPILSTSAEQTKDVARRLTATLPEGIVAILLIGELGAGKTTFVQGIAEGLGITERVTSPSFLMMKEHAGKRTLRHIDLYRIAETNELAPLGVLEDIPPDAVVVIEWADRIALDFTPFQIIVNFRILDKPDERELVITQRGFIDWKVADVLRLD